MIWVKIVIWLIWAVLALGVFLLGCMTGAALTVVWEAI